MWNSVRDELRELLWLLTIIAGLSLLVSALVSY
jgi:hypothetical protein